MALPPGVNEPCDRMWPLAGVLFSSWETVSSGGQCWIQALGDTRLSKWSPRVPGPKCITLSKWCKEKQKLTNSIPWTNIFKPLLSALYSMGRFIKGIIPAFPSHAGKENKHVNQPTSIYWMLFSAEGGTEKKNQVLSLPSEGWQIYRPEPHTRRMWPSMASVQVPSAPCWWHGLQSAAEMERWVMATGRQKSRKRWWNPNSTWCAGGGSHIGLVKVRVFCQAHTKGFWEGSKGDAGHSFPNSLAEKESKEPGEPLKPRDQPPGPWEVPWNTESDLCLSQGCIFDGSQ